MKQLIAVASVATIALIIGLVLVLQPKPDTNNSSTQTTNQEKKTVTPDATKLEIKDDVVGTGAEAKLGSSITVKYTGMLTDQTVFDSTEKQGGTPATFQLVEGGLIKGWTDGIPGMKVGGKRRLVIPSSLGYGEMGNQGIPPNATLIFDIELLDVK